ncbi:hypothetical protein [Embleya sp. NPDC059237]|uniref:hypothetical protein n=1 Tax=Embleya sp. NPDC059237 TaxID=3346784 RepID=UPI003686209C
MATRGKPTRQDAGIDEDTIVDELYGLAPDEFVAARDARAHTVRTAGDRAMAGRIGDLRRPVLAAWLANLLVREHRDEIDAFLRLGTAMRDAQEQLQGPELRELSRQRHRVIDALQHRALALAAAHGHPTVGDTTLRDLQDTLNTALADPEAAQRLAAGRLTAPLHPEGTFASAPAGRTTKQRKATPPAGVGKTGEATRATKATKATKDANAPKGAESAKGNHAAQARAARERARKQYESELAHARTTVEAAEKSAREATRTARERRTAAEKARARHTEALADVEALATRLDKARTTATRLGTAADKAEAEHERADQAAQDASTAARSARDNLDHVTATRPD